MKMTTQTIDSLTQTRNRDVFETEFTEALESAAKDNAPLSIATTDIDHFLQINQNHGHDVGDLVLKKVAETFKEMIPEDTQIYRIGGDEFCLIFPNTTREQALLTMERIRLEIAKPFKYDDKKEIEVALSVGIAAYPIDGSETTELYRQSDQALYRAKKDGRSQVYLAYDEKMVPKTVHFTETQLERLGKLSDELSVTEAKLLREALDDLISKYTVNKIRG